jgi:hypothetical protein
MPSEQLLTRGKVEAQAIASGANFDQDVPCGGASTLVVQVDMTAGAAGDLSVAVQPYEGDNLTVAPIGIPVTNSVGPTLSGGHDYFYAQYDVTAVDKVRVRITNNNVGAQTITRTSWRTQ